MKFSTIKKLGYKSTTMALCSLFVLAQHGAQAQNVPELIYYKFNAPGASVTNLASAPVSANGTVQGTASIGGAGMVGTGLVGSGTASATNSVNNNWALNLTGAWTISMWLKGVTNGLASNYLFGGAGGSTFRAMTGSGLVSGAGNLLIRGTGLTDIPINGIFDATGTPVVVTIVYNPTVPATLVYVNGIYVSQVAQSATLALTGTNFWAGGYDANNGLPTNGVMDEFRLYNRAVPSSEIAVTWNHELPLADPDNAGIGSLVTPDATPFCSNAFREVSVSVMNWGSNALNTATIHWSVDGVLQPSVTLPTPIANYSDSTIVVLGEAHFPTTAPIAIKAWTSMPNGVIDSDFSDDTLQATAAASLQGVEVDMQPSDTTICQGTTLTLDAGDYPLNPIYIWSNGLLTQTIDITAPGTYVVTVQNTIGCFDRDTITVSVHPNPVANDLVLMNIDGVCTFSVIGPQHIATYTWDFGDDSDTLVGGPSEQHRYLSSGEYTVTVTMRNQCATIVRTRTLYVNVDGTGIREKDWTSNIKIYPNPAKDKITLSSSSNVKIKQITIVNIIGQKVMTIPIHSYRQELNISELPAGIYSVLIDTEQGSTAKKIEIIR